MSPLVWVQPEYRFEWNIYKKGEKVYLGWAVGGGQSWEGMSPKKNFRSSLIHGALFYKLFKYAFISCHNRIRRWLLHCTILNPNFFYESFYAKCCWNDKLWTVSTFLPRSTVGSFQYFFSGAQWATSRNKPQHNSQFPPDASGDERITSHFQKQMLKNIFLKL